MVRGSMLWIGRGRIGTWGRKWQWHEYKLAVVYLLDRGQKKKECHERKPSYGKDRKCIPRSWTHRSVLLPGVRGRRGLLRMLEHQIQLQSAYGEMWYMEGYEEA